MRTLIVRELKRLRRKLGKQLDELEETGKAEAYRQAADSLLAHHGPVARGTHLLRVLNVHTHQEIEINLNPALDLHRNADLLYRKAGKAARATNIVTQKVAATRKEISRLEEALECCNACSRDEVGEEDCRKARESIEAILVQAGIVPPSMPSAVDHGVEERTPYRRFTVEEWEIFVGKTDAQNDELTTRFAKPRDIWLHVAAHAGSHVVIRRPKDRDWPPRPVIEKAAALAVWFSKAKHTSFAEVDVTEARFVRKRRGAPPGEVIAERCKRVRVAPSSPHDLFCAQPPGFLQARSPVKKEQTDGR